jgi:hypothetical protein
MEDNEIWGVGTYSHEPGTWQIATLLGSSFGQVQQSAKSR